MAFAAFLKRKRYSTSKPQSYIKVSQKQLATIMAKQDEDKQERPSIVFTGKDIVQETPFLFIAFIPFLAVMVAKTVSLAFATTFSSSFASALAFAFAFTLALAFAFAFAFAFSFPFVIP